MILLAGVAELAAQKKIYTDVLVVGGGTAGAAAGIQSARMGVKTIIAEETPWLGGMISAAGVSAFDGNHNMPSGIWAEFRERIYHLYGGPAKVATGWVSNTLFEPHAADSILKSMAASAPALTVKYRFRFQKTIVKGNQVAGVIFFDEVKKIAVSIYARQIIDATELGDVMAGADVPFDWGMEASALTGENVNIPETNDIIQDLTYVAVLKDYGAAADCTIVRPAGYDSLEFDGCCNEFCSHPSKLTSNVNAKKMLDYGRLPNGKYMINWPGRGNDIYLNLIGLTHEQRMEELKKAKTKTFRFLYFLQTHFGFKNLGLADDEYPTEDRLPFMPYHREGRRLKGMVRMKIQNIADPYNQPSALYRTGIAVGDYPVDHHHRDNPKAPQHLSFYPVPSYNIPLGALIPQEHDGIIVAEKGISVSNVVNGTTRLQPVVMLTGQAAGVLAALAVKQKKQAREVRIREVQKYLLNAGAYIMPYYDVSPAHPYFIQIQKTGATGILKGKGEPSGWANRTWFYPDSTVRTAVFIKELEIFSGKKINDTAAGELTIKHAIEIMNKLAPVKNKTRAEDAAYLLKPGVNNSDSGRKITRAELAVLLDKILDPFHSVQVDHSGNLIRRR